MKSVITYLDEIVKQGPEKIAYRSDTEQLTFSQVYDQSKSIATYLIDQKQNQKPVVVFMEKSPSTLAAYLGVMRAGCFYVPLDRQMPIGRIQMILDQVNPEYILCDMITFDCVKEFTTNANVVAYHTIKNMQPKEAELQQVHQRMTEDDTAYVVFTSGSTGMPKGVVGRHGSLVRYTEELCKVMEFGRETIFANQTPLYVDACFKEVFSTLKVGATTYFVPKELFVQPIRLIEYLNEHKINTLCWVSSALSLVSSLGTFQSIVPKYLHTIAFGSELFPTKQLKEWRRALPDATFVNLYGPTECTGVASFYKVDREFEESDIIPIGQPFPHTQIFLLDENGHTVKSGELGEIYICGGFLAKGYYLDQNKTDMSFIQSDLCKNTDHCEERLYKTGDLGKYNEFGELVFVSRKDHQIKHMGYRIELGEVEATVQSIDKIRDTACIYDEKKQKIVLYYTGDVVSIELKKILQDFLPRYMMPSVIFQIEEMPLTSNRKLDRMELEQRYGETNGTANR